MSNLAFPQAGIITSLDTARAKAKVLIPLYKIETSWIPVATNLLYDLRNRLTGIQVVSPEASTVQAEMGTVDAPASCPGTFGTWQAQTMTATQASAPSGSLDRIDYGTLQVGDEVVVVFINGNINDGRVIARI